MKVADSNWSAWCVILFCFAIGAFLEVLGDGFIRKAVETRNLFWALGGFASLILYGVTINLFLLQSRAEISFSKQLGIYVALFAVATVFWAWCFFGEELSPQHLVGLALILAGAGVIALR